MKTYPILLLFLFGLISCKEEITVLNQKIYFEKHYVNMAWVPQSTGLLIDSTGSILQFNWMEVSHIWYDPDSAGYIWSTDMDKNSSFCTPAGYRINADTLKLYVAKIAGASKGSISAPQHVMADAGTTTYSAFIFNPKTNRYKQVLLKTEGDIFTTNSAPEANEIYNWLKRIGK